MRSTAGGGIGFLSPAAGTSCQTSAGPTGQASPRSQSEAGHCGLDPDTRCQASLAGSPPLKGSLAPAVACAGHPHTAQGSVREAHSRDARSLPGRLPGPCRPGDGECWRECSSPGSSESPGPAVHAAWSEGSRALRTEDRPPSPGSDGPADTAALLGSRDAFASSFGFIRLSLGAAGQRGEAAPLHRRPQGMAAEAPASAPPDDPRALRTCSLQAAPAASAQGTGSASRPECGLADAGGAGDPGGCAWAARGWHALLEDWEPVLQGYLRGHRRQLEVRALPRL